MTINETSFEKASAIYQKLFSIGYLTTNFEVKLLCITLTCYVTGELRKKGKKVSCYDVLLKVGKSFSQDEKDGFLRALACICEDLMYGCEEFSTFGIEASQVPITLRDNLRKFCPF